MYRNSRYFKNIETLFKKEDCFKFELLNFRDEAKFVLKSMYKQNLYNIHHLCLFEHVSKNIFFDDPSRHNMIGEIKYNFNIFDVALRNLSSGNYFDHTTTLHIERIFVKEKYRRRKFGTLLLNFAEDDALSNFVEKSHLFINKNDILSEGSEKFFWNNSYNVSIESEDNVEMTKSLI